MPLLVGQPVQQRDDVAAGELGRVIPVVVPGEAETRGQCGDAVQVILHRCVDVCAAAGGELIEDPDLGDLPQPRLGDHGEVQVAADPEDLHVPQVLLLLGPRIGQGHPDFVLESSERAVHGLVAGAVNAHQVGVPAGSEEVRQPVQPVDVILDARLDAALQGDQYLQSNQLVQTPQVDDTAGGQTRGGGAPLLDLRIGVQL